MCYTDPLAAVLIAPPGTVGFDIAIGDGQTLGIPPSFGGPYVGFIALREELLRKIPGRLVGMTADNKGNRSFTLTLQTREQHIKREKATSNICTNHALMAFAVTVYMAFMGAGGLKSVGLESAKKAHILAEKLSKIDGFSLANDQPFLWEFVLRCPLDAKQFVKLLKKDNILPGIPLKKLDKMYGDHELLVCCTEMTADESIENYIKSAMKSGVERS